APPRTTRTRAPVQTTTTAADTRADPDPPIPAPGLCPPPGQRTIRADRSSSSAPFPHHRVRHPALVDCDGTAGKPALPIRSCRTLRDTRSRRASVSPDKAHGAYETIHTSRATSLVNRSTSLAASVGRWSHTCRHGGHQYPCVPATTIHARPGSAARKPVGGCGCHGVPRGNHTHRPCHQPNPTAGDVPTGAGPLVSPTGG